MNWPIRTTVLFIFSLFILFSCEDPGEIGLNGIGDETKLSTAFTDTITVKASTVLANDSIIAYAPPLLLAGRMHNNIFGAVTAQAFMGIGITAGATFDDAANARIDSTVLVLDYNEAYGDTTQNLTINVHKLQQGFQAEATYFANSTLTSDPAAIGSVTFKPTPRKTVKEVSSDGTTIVYRSIPVRIHLNNSFGNDLLAQSGKTPLSSAAEFKKFLPGLTLTTTNNASVVGFISTDSTYFRVYYTASGKRQKYDLFISAERFSQITADRSGSTLTNLQRSGDSVAATTTNNTAYLQESTGVKTKITFPYLDKLKQAVGNAAINRAELVIPVKNASTFKPSPYIYLFETNKRNRILRTGDTPRAIPASGVEVYTQPAAATYRESTQTYTIDITSYLQGILIKRKLSTGRTMQNTGFLLSPGSSASLTSSDALKLQTLRQTLLNTEPGTGIKLRVYYSAQQ